MDNLRESIVLRNRSFYRSHNKRAKSLISSTDMKCTYNFIPGINKIILCDIFESMATGKTVSEHHFNAIYLKITTTVAIMCPVQKEHPYRPQ